MPFSTRLVANCVPKNSAAPLGDRIVARQSARESNEDRLIARYFRPLAKHPGALGLIDDAAVITPPAGCDLVLTTDGVISGVHFFPEDPAGVIAKKVLRMNLSDLAAKGAKPTGFLMALAVPRDIEEAWLAAFAEGLGADAEHYGCPLLGGDTDRTPGPISISIAAIGSLPHGSMVLRSGATANDRIVVTGTIGDAALGLTLRKDPLVAPRWGLTAELQEQLVSRYLLPQPRSAIAESLRRHASAALDISDGLAGDLAKLCRASGVSAEVDIARVPLSQSAKGALAAEPALIETILTGGDDYEIVATVPADRLDALKTDAMRAGVSMIEIGGVVAGNGAPQFRDGNGKILEFARPSFSHF
jgi:thiamine-monophosphate kinase